MKNPVHPGHDLAVTMALFAAIKSAAPLAPNVTTTHEVDEAGRLEVFIEDPDGPTNLLRFEPGADFEKVGAEVREAIVSAQREWEGRD